MPADYTIGEFTCLVGLSVKALRFYGEVAPVLTSQKSLVVR